MCHFEFDPNENIYWLCDTHKLVYVICGKNKKEMRINSFPRLSGVGLGLSGKCTHKPCQILSNYKRLTKSLEWMQRMLSMNLLHFENIVCRVNVMGGYHANKENAFNSLINIELRKISILDTRSMSMGNDNDTMIIAINLN